MKRDEQRGEVMGEERREKRLPDGRGPRRKRENLKFK
jgi:hypothetical protein